MLLAAEGHSLNLAAVQWLIELRVDTFISSELLGLITLLIGTYQSLAITNQPRFIEYLEHVDL